MDISTDPMRQLLTVNSTEVRLPGQPRSVATFDDLVVVVLNGRTEEKKEYIPERAKDMSELEPDFELSSPKGHIAGINKNGKLVWISKPTSELDDQGYKRCHQFHSRCLCLTVNGDTERDWFEIDPQTGEVLHEYPRDSFKLAGEIRQFEQPITGFLTINDIAIVEQKSRKNSRLWTGTAFDPAENKIWEREFTGWFLREKDGKLVSQIEHRMGAKTIFEHDLKTGEPRISDSIASERSGLQEWLPSRLHHLIDDYLDRIDHENS